MKIKTTAFLVFTSSVFWFFITENAITDLLFSSAVKQYVVFTFILSIFIIVLCKFKIWFQTSYYLYILASILALLSIALRFYYVDDETIFSLAKTLFKFISVMILLIVMERIFLSINLKNTNLTLPHYIQVISFVLLASFIFYIINPITYYSFNDHAGHNIKVVYGSLSSSIYRIGSINFARLNFIFDEPGTFGMFISFLVSFMFYLQKRLTFFSLLVILVGLVSVSLSYILFLLCFFFYLLSKRLLFRQNWQTLLLIIFTVLSLGSLFQFKDEQKIIGYVFERLESIYSNNHNRSDGNSEALNAIISHPEGVSVSDFERRQFSSSGMFVIAAYHSLLYALSFAILYIGFMFFLIRRGGDWFPLVIALSITFLTRNNLFNYSGAGIMLLAIYICYLSLGNKNKVNINKGSSG